MGRIPVCLLCCYLVTIRGLDGRFIWCEGCWEQQIQWVERSITCVRLCNLSYNALWWWNREDNASDCSRPRAILDFQGLPFVCCFLSSFFSFLRLTVSFSQKRGFPLKAGGSPTILAAKTWQYFLKYGCGVRFSFCCHLLYIVASLFTLLTSLHSRRPSLYITFFPTLSLFHKTRSRSPKHRRGESEWITRSRSPQWITRSRSPKHRRGESEWIRLRPMDSPTFLSTSRSSWFGDLHASTSAHHDVYTGGNLLRIMQHFQTRTSTYGLHLSGILLDATFFI